jgi:hypothetical protein
MAIDVEPFVEMAQNQFGHNHYDGCEFEHIACATQYLAGALDAAQKRLDEYAAEIQRLRVESNHSQNATMDYFESWKNAQAEIERLRAENAEARAFNAPLIRDWAGDVWAFDDDDSVTHLPESVTQPDLSIESDTQEPRQSFLEWRQELRGIIGPNVDTYLGETLNELEEDNHA